MLRNPEVRQVLAHVLGDEAEELLHELRFAGIPLAQLRVLGGDTDRAGVEVADPHHDAARHDQRGRREPELLRTQERRDHDVPRGAHPAVALDGDAVAETVEHECLLGVGQPDLPRRPGMLHRRQRGGAGSAVVPGDQDHVGVRLADAGGDRSHTHRADQLHVDPGPVVGVLQVVDQLGEIFDRVDVVVRRRRDQPDPRRRVPGLRDPRVHLVRRQLAALTGLRALRHLDLDVAGVDQVVAGDTEPPARHLLDGAAAGRLAEAPRRSGWSRRARSSTPPPTWRAWWTRR